MQLLFSMSFATPETRLVLLTWAVRFGHNFQSGTRDVLAQDLGVSKRNLGTALEYLEQEGYLWKIKSPFKRQEHDKSKVRFAYVLSADCWRMWKDCFTACSWSDELVSVLSGKSLAEVQSTEKSAGLNVNARLVWAVLLMRSNSGRYVIGSYDSSLCLLTGLEKSALTRAINSLVRKGVITIVAGGVKQNKLFPYLPPIYKMQQQQPGTKILKFGVPLSNSFMIPLRCISRLVSFYRRACKLPAGQYPKQGSELSSEQYFQLSKFFSSQALAMWTHHVCLSTIISSIPVCVSTNADGNRKKREIINELRSEIMATYLQNFGCDWLPISFPDYAHGNKVRAVRPTEIDILRDYIFEVLIAESVSLVLELSDSWRLFVECMGGNCRIVDYQIRERMVSINSQSVVDKSSCEGKDENVADLVDIFTPCVLTVIVPDSDSYSHCMALGESLFMSNSNIKHPKVRHAQHLIYGSNSSELTKKKRSLISDQSDDCKLPKL
jgi:hypothetical protein